MTEDLSDQGSARDWGVAGVGALAAVLLAHLLFDGFFPGPKGVGHDYAGGLTGFLAEYYWSLSEGPWSPPWFTPAFCGGIPFYADPVNPFFSLPGFLMRFLDINPLTSAYLTFMVSVAVGFIGTVWFVRSRLAGSVAAALLAAMVFSLNGFLSSRMLIGHTMYHGVMLAPLIAFWLTDGRLALTTLARLLRVALSGLAIAYWVYSGGGVMIVAFGLATVLLIALAWLRGSRVSETLLLGSAATLIALALSASKISAALSYMASFPRSGYLLPGYTGVLETLQVIFTALFTSGATIAQYSQERLTNVQWIQDRHELEYGVTVIPLLLVALAALVMLLKPRPVRPLDAQTLMTEDRPEFPTRTLVIVLAMIAIIAVPIALNTYGEAWNAFLKSLPLIGSSSALMRWFIVYVPFVAVIGGLAVDRITSDSRQRLMLSLVAAVGVAVALASTDRKFYEQQAYDPAPVLEAFEAARKNPGARPAISAVGAFVDPKGNILLPVNRQDLMIRGVSQLACYIPIFGYRLEFFPFRTLRPGSIYDTDGQGFNIKNPACFVFPKENNCAVGDHFPTSRRADLESFASYRSFPFEKSTGQKLADALSLVSLVLVMGVLGFALLMTLRRRIHDGA